MPKKASHGLFHNKSFMKGGNMKGGNMNSVLGSQLFSGFWIGKMIEHSTKSNSKNPKKLDVQSIFNVKNPKKLDFEIFVGFLLDFWVGSKQKNPIQSNNPIKIQQKSTKSIQQGIERGLNIQLF
jgi:hypothetical protein